MSKPDEDGVLRGTIPWRYKAYPGHTWLIGKRTARSLKRDIWTSVYINEDGSFAGVMLELPERLPPPEDEPA